MTTSPAPQRTLEDAPRVRPAPPVEHDRQTDQGPVMLVGSSGGHLAQLYRLEGWWRGRDRVWVTFDTDDATSLLADEHLVPAHHPTTRNIPNLLRNFVLAWRMLRQHRPEVVVSTGAGLAVPFFVLARLMGIRTSYIEVYDRIDHRTLTGRLCYPFTDLFLVQWEEQRRLYPRAAVVGRLL